MLIGNIYEPTQVRYLAWFGPMQAYWNFDQVPAGVWRVQTSKDLINWSDLESGPVFHLSGPSCLTHNLPPESGFARLVRRSE